MRWLWIVLTWVVVLGGCASSRTGADTAATTLTVHIGVFGGPARPNGGMAVSNAPRAGAAVTVTDGSGNQWHATTDRDGIARFSVAPGQYAVHDPCDFRDHHVTVRAGKLPMSTRTATCRRAQTGTAAARRAARVPDR